MVGILGKRPEAAFPLPHFGGHVVTAYGGLRVWRFQNPPGGKRDGSSPPKKVRAGGGMGGPPFQVHFEKHHKKFLSGGSSSGTKGGGAPNIWDDEPKKNASRRGRKLGFISPDEG